MIDVTGIFTMIYLFRDLCCGSQKGWSGKLVRGQLIPGGVGKGAM